MVRFMRDIEPFLCFDKNYLKEGRKFIVRDCGVVSGIREEYTGIISKVTRNTLIINPIGQPYVDKIITLGEVVCKFQKLIQVDDNVVVETNQILRWL